MTYGCAGINTSAELKKKLDWKTKTFKGVHLATFDRFSKNGTDIRTERKHALERFNERPRALRIALFKPTCSDMIANHRGSPVSVLGAGEAMCGEISFLRTFKDKGGTRVLGDFTLDGPKARTIAELIEEKDNGPDFKIFFSPKVIVTDLNETSKLLVSISTFNVTPTIL